jgi:serine/threonine protein kinase
MSEQPHRPNPPDGDGCPPSAPPPSESALDKPIPPTDDTPTIISKMQPRPNAADNLFGGMLLRGRKLAHFELIEPIGVGGMAAVLRARDTQLERFVALKILPPEMASDPENVARFHQEARAAARLDHETIARVFYCGEDQNLHFIAFEFVEGENLRMIIDRRGPLPVPEALHYMLQVATGLAHAADRGVVHRDIKPSNIIITPNGRAKLVDMGLARNLGPQTDNGLTQSGVTLGTFDYISPEQALEPRDADVRSDIYSLGCTFYHVLTGQPPVPEGTAARKLHHHQHVPPIDPRQLNPEIPDEVAAILSRMMAKDPRHRYQRPEHLVQHLLQATQRLGAGEAAPDEVMFVDAALPTPPRSRPLLVVGCAAAIVVALVILVGPSRRDSRFPSPAASGPDSTPVGPVVAEQQGGSVTPPGPPAENGGGPKHEAEADADKPIAKAVASWADLSALAEEMVPEKSYVITVKQDLWRDGEDPLQDVVLHGKSITLTGDAPRRVIWSRYVADTNRAGGLVLEAEEVRLRRLRLVADANNNALVQLAAGVLLRGALRSATFTECEFLQGNGSRSPDSPYNSVAVASKVAAPAVQFDRCCFLGAREVKRPAARGMGDGDWLAGVAEGGQTAVAIQGGATVSAADCAFGPHTALFRFDKGNKSRLTLQRCTALTGDEWALASLVGRASAAVEAERCLFARATAPAPPPEGMAMMGDRRAAVCLVRYDKDSRPADDAYIGRSNRYLNIDAVSLATGDTAPATALSSEQLKGNNDERALAAGAHPFKNDDPLALLQGPLTADDLQSAFRLNFNGVPALVVTEGGKPVAGVGMEKSPWGAAEWTGADLPTPATMLAGKKVVDPRENGDSARGIYSSLEAALADAKPGDEIAIRCNGELPIRQTMFVKSSAGSVTIKRADESWHPILVLDKDHDGPQAALFNVQGGQLSLESLEFRLRPKGDRFDSQAVAKLGGDGSVTFKDCVVTLDGRESALPLAAVMLPDYKEAMLTPGASGTPKAVFDGCFIRGDGDLVLARASRRFDVDVRQSLVALTGSLLNVDLGAREAAPDDKQQENLRLERVTAYLGGHLARLKAANLKSLAPIHCSPVKSLLVSAGDRKALLHVEAGPAKAPEAARALLPWKGEGNNYANFSPMLDQQPGDNEGAFPAASDEWRAADTGSKSDEVKFPERLWPDPASELSLADLSPTALAPMSGPKDVGVNVRLPVPAGYNSSAPPESPSAPE